MAYYEEANKENFAMQNELKAQTFKRKESKSNQLPPVPPAHSSQMISIISDYS